MCFDYMSASTKLKKKQGYNYERKIKKYLMQKYIVVKMPSNYPFDFLCLNRNLKEFMLVEVRSTHKSSVKIPAKKIRLMRKYARENLKRFKIQYLGVVVFINKDIVKYVRLDEVRNYYVKAYED